MTAVDHEAAIAQLLAELGDTADAVADRLRALGVKGQRAMSQHCPIANYVRANAPGLSRVRVLPTAVKFRRDGAPISAWQWVVTPDAVHKFANNFDAGVYLDLMEVAG